jgi:transglutaminase-like putative cysteine protease
MQPRSDRRQQCLHFSLTTAPAARVMVYQDHDGNAVHHFDIPVRHARLTLTAEALVEALPPRPAAGGGGRGRLGGARRTGPLGRVLRVPGAERVRQADAAARRAGARAAAGARRRPAAAAAPGHARAARAVRVPAAQHPGRFADRRSAGRALRRVPGLLARVHRARPPARHPGALRERLPVPRRRRRRPPVGGRDPRVDGGVRARHRLDRLRPDQRRRGRRAPHPGRGRDYADVPPTRGVFKGVSDVQSELSVSVSVGPVRSPLTGDLVPFTPWMSRDASAQAGDAADAQQQQQQQQ